MNLGVKGLAVGFKVNSFAFGFNVDFLANFSPSPSIPPSDTVAVDNAGLVGDRISVAVIVCSFKDNESNCSEEASTAELVVLLLLLLLMLVVLTTA